MGRPDGRPRRAQRADRGGRVPGARRGRRLGRPAQRGGRRGRPVRRLRRPSRSRRRLARPFALALVAWGIPIVLLAGAPTGIVAFVLVAFIGAANSIEDVAGFTLLQRIVDDSCSRASWAPSGAHRRGAGNWIRGDFRAAGRRRRYGRAHHRRRLPARIDAHRLGAPDRARRTAMAPAELERIAAVPMFEPLPIATKGAAGAPARALLGAAQAWTSSRRARRATGSTSSARASSWSCRRRRAADERPGRLLRRDRAPSRHRARRPCARSRRRCCLRCRATIFSAP